MSLELSKALLITRKCYLQILVINFLTKFGLLNRRKDIWKLDAIMLAWEVKKLQYLIPQLLCQEMNQGLHPSTSPKPPSHCVTKAPWSRDVTQISNIICKTLRHSMPPGLHWNTQCLKNLGSILYTNVWYHRDVFALMVWAYLWDCRESSKLTVWR